MTEAKPSGGSPTAASRTALSASLMRAAHTRCDSPRLIDDAWGDRLVAAEEKAGLYRRVLAVATPEARTRLLALGSEQAVLDATLRAHPTYGGVIIRSRYAEDALAAAVTRGVAQYVLIGAGFDSFSVRQPPWAHGLTIFEVDRPASQAMKRQRLADCAAQVPPNVHFVAADLSAEPLPAALARSGFSPRRPAFFSWLGVTIYLTREANLATLRGVAMAGAPGSELVFTYIDQRILESSAPPMQEMRSARAADGEAWISGFDPTSLAAELRSVGLELLEDLSGASLRERYCAERRDGLSPGIAGHVARARVVS